MLSPSPRIGAHWDELRVILDSVPAFIWYKDADNRIIRANRLAAESMGLSVAAIEGRSTYELHPEHAAKYHRDDLEVIHSGHAKLGIVEPFVTAAGARRWVRTDKVPYRDESGHVAGVIVFSVDITERVDAENALREARDTLERRVTERTKELASAVAELRREMAERQRAEDRIGQHQAELAHLQRLRTVEGMTTQIAHEINQPLGAIANFASGLARRLRSESPDLEALATIATQISQQAMRAAEVVRRLRDLVRKEDSARKACDIEQIIDEAVQMMASNARRRGVALRTSIAPALPTVFVDRIQIQQVLLNLIANGLDAIDAVAPIDVRPGEPEEVIVEAIRRDPRSVEIRVHDTGVGLTNADAEGLFEPFFSTKTEGLGMGLAISRTIVEAHGGELRAVGGDGRGATFAFTLPVTTS
jgi:PAS domain S-box-containing protein